MQISYKLTKKDIIAVPFCTKVIKKEQSTDCGCEQGVRLKRIGNARCSAVEAVEVVGSLVLIGLQPSPRGNKWCPGWRELVAILSLLFSALVSCRAMVEGS